MGKVSRPVKMLWNDYIESRSPELRQKLIEHYLPQVAKIASRVHQRVPRSVQIDDLVSAGTFGLMYAIGTFKPEKLVKFETYCQQRIRGAMLDHLRSCDVLTRQTRARVNQLQQISAEIQNRLGRQATEEELRDRMKLKPQQFDRLMRFMQSSQTISLSRTRCSGEGTKDLTEGDALEDTRAMPISHDLQRRDLLRHIVKGLTRQNRLLIILYYYEQLTMKEIGATLGISESRVSQLHNKVIDKIRNRVTQRQNELREMAA